MPTIELNKALDSLQMAKRQKTDADNVSEKEEPFPTEPSDIVKGLVLSAYRRPDINEIKYSVDEGKLKHKNGITLEYHNMPLLVKFKNTLLF